jgi:nicotinamide-nucleotide amidase
MRAAILAIGDELTCGYRLDTNSQTIAQRLGTVPLGVVLHLTVEDDLEAIQAGLRAALRMAEVVIATGGLGPTEDDLTRQAVAAFLGRPLIENAEALERIRERYARRGRAMPECNRIQAQVPRGSEIIYNDRGTASGFYLQVRDKHLFVVPGVPYEMEGMLASFILPRLRDRIGGNLAARRGVLKLFGPTESEIAERIQAMLVRGRNPLLGLLPHRGVITVEIVAWGISPQEATALLEADLATLKDVFGDAVLCQDERDLPQVVGDMLSQQRLTLAVTEAIDGTGGLATARLAGSEGSESWLRQGLVTKTGSAREESEALATRVRQTTGADVGLATGAILYPQDAAPDRPYGVLTAAVDLAGEVSCQCFSYSGNRARVREWAAEAALGLLRLRLLDHQAKAGQ